MDVFQRLNAERGITVLLITHELDIAEYGTPCRGVPRRPRIDSRRQPVAAAGSRDASWRPCRPPRL